jgi:CelD/BcsL family acetyltransferase involved in cellulose biosynthesis
MPTGHPPELTCAVVTDPARLEALRPDWRALLGRSACDGPMLGPTWLTAWWRVFGPLQGRRLRLALFHDGGRLVGLAPLLTRAHWYQPGIPFRRLEPLGAGERGEDTICSDYLSVVAERGAERRVAARLAAALAAGALGGWDELVLPAMDGLGEMPGLLAEAFRGAGLGAAVTVTGSAPFAVLPATWGAYLEGLGKKGRYAVLRGLRDFERWAGGPGRLERATSPAELARGTDVLIDLHQRRWRAAGQPGRFAVPRFRQFHEAVLPQLLADGALELAWLCARGEPVAAQYNLVWGDKVYFYQCGRRADLPGHVRPGAVLLAHLIRAAIEAGRREFDFLAGEALYKSRLASATRPVVQVRAARPSWREQARRLAEYGRGWARQVRRAARGSGPASPP